MPVHKIERVGDTWKIWKDSGGSDDLVAVVVEGSAANAAIITNFYQRNLFDVRTPLADLPSTASEKTVDPARPDYFWDGADLVSRAVGLTITWDGLDYQINLVRLRVRL